MISFIDKVKYLVVSLLICSLLILTASLLTQSGKNGISIRDINLTEPYAKETAIPLNVSSSDIIQSLVLPSGVQQLYVKNGKFKTRLFAFSEQGIKENSEIDLGINRLDKIDSVSPYDVGSATIRLSAIMWEGKIYTVVEHSTLDIRKQLVNLDEDYTDASGLLLTRVVVISPEEGKIEKSFDIQNPANRILGNNPNFTFDSKLYSADKDTRKVPYINGIKNGYFNKVLNGKETRYDLYDPLTGKKISSLNLMDRDDVNIIGGNKSGISFIVSEENKFSSLYRNVNSILDISNMEFTGNQTQEILLAQNGNYIAYTSSAQITIEEMNTGSTIQTQCTLSWEDNKYDGNLLNMDFLTSPNGNFAIVGNILLNTKDKSYRCLNQRIGEETLEVFSHYQYVTNDGTVFGNSKNNEFMSFNFDAEIFKTLSPTLTGSGLIKPIFENEFLYGVFEDNNKGLFLAKNKKWSQ